MKSATSYLDSQVIQDLLVEICEKSQIENLNAQDIVRDLVKHLQSFYQEEKTV